MRYGSICSGVSPQSPDWSAMGMECAWFAEIEPFPSAVLKYHFPDVPNLGDFTKIGAEHGPIDLLVGGTPCQSFSVAGKRAGLDDARGNLTLEFARLLERLHPRWFLWENVPGVLSIDEGRTFGTFLGILGQLGYGFAYRILDAQFFGVPQRRRRVFVVGHLGDWRRAAAVLFERHSLSGNPAPRRETRQGVAPTISARTKGGGGLGTDFDCDGGLVLNDGESWCPNCMRRDGHFHDCPNLPRTFTDIAPTLNAHFGDKQGLEDQHVNGGCGLFVTHSLRADGFDASEDGTGRGTPLVPMAYRTAGDGAVYEEGHLTAPLTTATDPSANIIAFSAKDYGADASEDISPTLRAGGHTESHANAGVMPAIAFYNEATLKISEDVCHTLRARNTAGGVPDGVAYPINDMATRYAGTDGSGHQTGKGHGLGIGGPEDPMFTLTKGDKHAGAVQPHMAVRRLIPRECERLQGMEDDWTLVPFRNKPAADGPRYKAIGNSWAVPVLNWIGRRILEVDEIESDCATKLVEHVAIKDEAIPF